MNCQTNERNNIGGGPAVHTEVQLPRVGLNMMLILVSEVAKATYLENYRNLALAHLEYLFDIMRYSVSRRSYDLTVEIHEDVN